MKIGIDISQIVHSGSGVARFTDGLVNSILENDTKNQWTFFFYSLRQSFPNSRENAIKQKGHRLIKLPLPPTAVSALWNNIHRFNIENLIGNLDWFISSDWVEPPSNLKKATIIHDLAYLRFPETIHPKILKNQTQRINWIKKESSIIFTDSLSTKKDVIDLLMINPNKIYVNYPGLNPTKLLHNYKEVLSKYQIAKPYILSVGKLEPRKNLKRLIEAYSSIKEPKPDLVIVGSKGWDEEIEKIINKNEKIKLLGYLNDRDLSILYQQALFFIYPSIWEGFGFPVLEAMQNGAPVAVSNSSSLVEIAKNNAIYFDPMSVQSISQTMKRLIDDAQLRNVLKNKGVTHVKQFAWKKYYNLLINTLTINNK